MSSALSFPKKFDSQKTNPKLQDPSVKKCRTPRLKTTHKTETLRLIIQDFEMEAKFSETHVFPGTIYHSYKVNWKKTLAFIQNYSGY